MTASNLFDDSPIAIWEEDFSAAKKYLEEKLHAAGMPLMEYIEKHPDELLQTAGRIRITDANAMAIKTFRAGGKQAFIDNYSRFFDETTMPMFIDFIGKVMEGTTHSDEGIIVGARALDGEKIFLNLSWNVDHDHTDDFSKLWFFAIDISAQVHAEAALRDRERLFRSLFETMNEGAAIHEVIYADDGSPSDYKIIDVNPAYEKILDLPRDIARGALASALYGAGEPPYLDIFAGVANTGQSTFFETYFPPMEKHFSISVYSPGKGMFVTVFTNITERKKSEEKILQSEQTFKAQFKGFPLPTVLWKKEGDDFFLTDYNQAAKNISLSDMNKLLGMELAEFFKMFPKVIQNTRECFEKQKNIRMEQEYRLTSLNRVFRVFDIYYVYLPPDMVVLHGEDITDRKKNEEELKRHREQLEELVAERTLELERATSQLQQAQKMEALGVLAGGIAHDFNNIIATIGVTAEVLLKTIPHNASAHSKLERILKSSNRAKDLTMKLLTFARKEKLNVREAHPSELVNDVIDILKRTISKTIRIQWDLSDNIQRIAIDFNQLVQALLNICLNACDAMPEGGTLKIETIECVVDQAMLKGRNAAPGKFCRISITDDGEGIEQEIINNIFEPFFTTKEVGKGSGLGLAVCHSIIKEHKGFIDVESSLGKGTTFFVYVPVSEADELRLDEKVDTTPSPRKIGTVLLIDDDKNFLQTAAESLELEGFDVLVANSGRRGVETYSTRKNEIQAVVMDMMMPEMDGVSVFRAIREINPEAKVLISSGYSVEGKATELLKLGAVGFIQKPFHTLEILEALSNILKD